MSIHDGDALTQERKTRRARLGGFFVRRQQFDDKYGNAQHYPERQHNERYFEISDGKYFGRLVILGIDRLVFVKRVLGHVAVPLEHQSGLIDPRQQHVYPPLVRRIPMRETKKQPRF